MSQGNPNKVNAIVDEIVKNNYFFKLKSPIEQDKEKDSIAKSINSAISILNEVGKELVLQELSVDPDEKFKGFIDSVGNIDISGLTQMTTTVVKAKIEEAEREGIDLRQGQTVFKDSNKTLVIEGVLTVAVINEMVSNFDNLSSKERQSLFNQWGDLSPEQKDIIYESTHKKINNSKLNNKDKKILDTALDIVSETDKATLELPEDEKFIADYLKIYPTDTQEIINFKKQLSEEGNQLTPQEKIYRIKQFESSLYGKLMTCIDECASNNEITPINRNLIRNTTSNFIAIMKSQFLILKYKLESGLITQDEYNNMLQELNSKKQQVQNKVILIKSLNKNIAQKRADRKAFSEDTYDNVTTEEAKNIINYNIEDITTSNVKEKIGKIISKEIEQLPSVLTKANFSQKEIKEAITQYKSFFEQLEDDDRAYLSKLSTSKLSETLTSEFEEMEINQNSKEILKIMSNITFNGTMQQILLDSNLREQFLAQFDSIIEQGFSLEQNVKLDGELEELFSQYFQDNAVDMTVSDIETQKEQATDEQVKQEQPKEPKLSEQIPTVLETKTTPEEHIPKSVTSHEQEISEETSQNMAMVKQDNSFIGKVKRVFANMKDMKNKDNSKGFFARLGDSVKNVFGNKKEEYYEKQDTISTNITTEDKSQPTTNSQQTNYLTQHFDVNTQEAIKRTEESKKAKEFLSTEDKETDDLLQ